MINEYQPNLDSMKQYLTQENEKNERGDGPNWWSIPSGMSSVRLLPPWDPTGRVALPVYMHPIEFKGKDMAYTKYNWTCVNKTFNKPCLICDGLATLSAAGIDTSNWEATRRQFYFNAIVMHDPTFDQKGKGTAPGTLVLMKAPKTFYDWAVSQITNPMIGDITSLANGIDVYITKEGSGLGTSYSMTLSPNGRTAIPQEYLNKIQSLYNLDDIFSAGFEKEQVDELVNHLKGSAGAFSSGVGTTINQMAGYPQPTMPVPSQVQIPPYNPMQQTAPPVNPGMPSPAVSPYAQGVVAPPVAPPPSPAAPSMVPLANPQPVVQAPAENLPKCYGQYDSGSVNCVVCPHEINCSQQK